MTSDPLLAEFGRAVLAARTARGWTLTQLTHEALGNQERKSYVSRVENGRQPLSPLTVRKFAQCLGLPGALVARMLRLPAPPDDAPDATEARADRLLAATEGDARRLKVSEAMAIGLAYEYAEGQATDIETALKELRRAFEVAAGERDRLPSNLGEAVERVVARVRALNDQGRIEEASAEIDRAIEADREREAEVGARIEALHRQGVTQAIIARSVAGAVRHVLALVDREEGDFFAALRDEWSSWLVRGRDRGLAFDLEVAIVLARESVRRARGADERGTASNDLAVALSILGEREPHTARLDEAVAAFREALTERTRERMPLDWAMTQNNLGNALQALGAREPGIARLDEAVAAYREALLERTREQAPLDWAMTQNNLGNALSILDQREPGTARLDEAVTAFREALLERTREQAPLNWAMTTFNCARVEVTRFQKTDDPSTLASAERLAKDARAVFAEAQAGHYLAMADALLTQIAFHRAP